MDERDVFEELTRDELIAEVLRLRQLRGTPSSWVTEGEEEAPLSREPSALREVSCRNCAPIIGYVEGLGLDAEEFWAGLGFDLEQLRESNNWITWREFCRFCAPLEERFSDEDMRELGRQVLDSPPLRLFAVVGAVATDAPALVRWLIRVAFGRGAMLFRGIDPEVIIHANDRATIYLHARPGRALPRVFAPALAGSFEVIGGAFGSFRVCGEPEWTLDFIRLELRVEPSSSLKGKLSGAWRSWTKRGLSHEIRIAYEHLLELNQQAERHLEQLRRSEQRREELEERLRQGLKLEALGRFAGAISHDFSNMLTIMSSHAEFALEEMEMGEDPRPDLELVLETSRKASRLTSQLLAFGRQRLVRQAPLQLHKLLVSNLELLTTLAGPTVELQLDSDPSLPFILGDPSQLEQILTNLIANARDAMPRGGVIFIETSLEHFEAEDVFSHSGLEPGDYVQLSVADSGVGMSAQVRSRIFEPFFTTKGEGGNGLGLATVYGIVRQMSGGVWVYSEPGEGTTFKLFFPVASAAARALAPEPGAALRELSGERARVLLLEDDVLVRRLAARALEEQGHTVHAFGEVSAALGALEPCEDVDLIISDIALPGLTGIEFAHDMRERCPDMRIVLMSGYTNGSSERSGAFEVVDALIQKPFRPSTLRAVVDRVLAGGDDEQS